MTSEARKGQDLGGTRTGGYRKQFCILVRAFDKVDSNLAKLL